MTKDKFAQPDSTRSNSRLMSFLKSCLDDGKSSSGRRTAIVLQTLILLSVVIFTVQTVPSIAHSWQTALDVAEAILVGVFTIEYLLRATLASPSRSYIASRLGLIDLLAIAPFYLGFTGFQTLRILRVLRLLRILKLARYSRALVRLQRAFVIAREELVLFAFLACVVMYPAAVGIYYFERDAQPDRFQSIPHSFWWAIVTLTTVGYGDAYPVTAGGRLFTGLVLVTSLGIVSIPSGIIASSLTDVRNEDDELQRQHDSQHG